MSELTLARAKKGDVKAFEEIILLYEKLIYSVSYKYMGNAEDAKDVAQESILKIYKNISICKSMDKFKSWAARITSNTAIDFLRKRKVKLEPIDDLPLASPDLPEETAERNETLRAVAKALKMLPEEVRTLIILRDLQGFSYEELAQTLELPLGTVKSKLSRARILMRKTLSELEGGI
ncbi:MAG: RNA polymerase sigma factor [Clostridiales bacterium]|jgi:RNA polymerase sigma-70 factor (ECF subfamily)|nr:RNA polymerase sigma factor [Clostridiales bacterium]